MKGIRNDMAELICTWECHKTEHGLSSHDCSFCAKSVQILLAHVCLMSITGKIEICCLRTVLYKYL